MISTIRTQEAQGGFIDNEMIAALNDMAYRGVRNQGLQKKLDERALKNREFYKELEIKIDEAKENIDFDKIKERHQELA